MTLYAFLLEWEDGDIDEHLSWGVDASGAFELLDDSIDLRPGYEVGEYHKVAEWDGPPPLVYWLPWGEA